MKSLTLIIMVFLLCVSTNGNCQNFESYGKTNFYQLTIPTFVVASDDSTKITLATARLIFTELKVDANGDHLIQFWNLKSANNDSNLDETDKGFLNKYIYNNIDNKKANKIVNDLGNLKLFRLKAKDFKNNVIPYFNAWGHRGSLDWSSGVVVLPLKSRYNPSYTFSKDLTLGISGGFKMRISHRNPTFLNFLANVGISSVTIDGYSSNGKLTTASEHAGFTQAVGVVFENHSYQFGIFWGKDRLTKNDAVTTDWIYNNRGWLSLGIGYQLFKADNKESKNSTAGNNSN